ncbi:MAG: exosortase K [Flavobacteriales bacterium]|nr:exosortase K [Flavobacteriales bacterium]
MSDPERHRRATLALTALLLAGAFALKWWYREATAHELGFVLRPVSALVAMLTGTAAVHEAEGSFLFPVLGIRIDRSCSGINFLVIATACFALLILRRTDAGCARPLLAALAVGGAYALTIAVNAGRISTMAFAKQLGLHLAPRAHEAVGAFFFVSALLVAALLLNRLLRPPARA